ncbi:MAG: carboxypeptidase-like regulatory domain-containing protein [Bacteroidales bacterium]|jgi:hypothetical protein|nr:carboxypeptidase-like regulatory domain-containing protein [Bacteroidales bacterium]
MTAYNGNICKYFTAIALLISLLPPHESQCQGGILDSIFSFRAGIIRTGSALDLITRETGYHFTYDSRLVDAESRTKMSFRETTLKLILDSLLLNDSLVYSVIDEFIIISRDRSPDPYEQAPDTSGVPPPEKITGIVLDGETREPLPSATLALLHTGRGTITNSNGEFGLNLHPEDVNDTIVVSYLGYYAREIPVRQSFGNNFIIAMRSEFYSIPEIIIKNQIPREIIFRTLSSAGRNYGNTPAGMTAFYREGIQKKNQLQTYSEAILQIYKSAYTGTLLNDQIKVLKSRKIENINTTDTLTVRLKAGLSTSLELDGIRNGFDFLSRENFQNYSYRVTDIVSFDEEWAYEIEFGQKEGSEMPMFRGSVFINTEDYALLKAEFEIYPGYLQKMKSSFISSPSKDFSTWPSAVKYSVSYRKIGDRYFLSHVRGDLEFLSKQKKRVFNTQFRVFFEMAVTSISTDRAERFEREELAPSHSVFSRTISNYDNAFWGSQDFVRPEENLIQALKDMKVRLQEFSE